MTQRTEHWGATWYSGKDPQIHKMRNAKAKNHSACLVSQDCASGCIWNLNSIEKLSKWESDQSSSESE